VGIQRGSLRQPIVCCNSSRGDFSWIAVGSLISWRGYLLIEMELTGLRAGEGRRSKVEGRRGNRNQKAENQKISPKQSSGGGPLSRIASQRRSEQPPEHATSPTVPTQRDKSPPATNRNIFNRRKRRKQSFCLCPLGFLLLKRFKITPVIRETPH
jgi:hypothetical protein